MTIYFKRLHPAAIVPSQAHEGDAGLDLFLVEPVTIQPGERVLLGTGVAWEPDMQAALLIRPRSSTSKQGIDICEGTVDCQYRGEIKVLAVNNSVFPVSFDAGNRIAQAVPMFVPSVRVFETDTLSMTRRGEGGFGSTGR
jgi:dUTP pyrophosphatase